MNIKNNFYDIVKLFVNQIGITIFSLILYTSIGFVEDEKTFNIIYICLSAFASVFYLSLLYTAAWDIGARDKIRVDGGKIAPMKWKGALCSVFANLPNFILAIFSIIFVGIYLLTSAEWASSVGGIFILLLRFLNTMFLGILGAVFSFTKSYSGGLYDFCLSVGYFFMLILPVLATHLGYTFGMKEYRIFGFLKPKQQKKK